MAQSGTECLSRRCGGPQFQKAPQAGSKGCTWSRDPHISTSPFHQQQVCARNIESQGQPSLTHCPVLFPSSPEHAALRFTTGCRAKIGWAHFGSGLFLSSACSHFAKQAVGAFCVMQEQFLKSTAPFPQNKKRGNMPYSFLYLFTLKTIATEFISVFV